MLCIKIGPCSCQASVLPLRCTSSIWIQIFTLITVSSISCIKHCFPGRTRCVSLVSWATSSQRVWKQSGFCYRELSGCKFWFPEASKSPLNPTCIGNFPSSETECEPWCGPTVHNFLPPKKGRGICTYTPGCRGSQVVWNLKQQLPVPPVPQVWCPCELSGIANLKNIPQKSFTEKLPLRSKLNLLPQRQDSTFFKGVINPNCEFNFEHAKLKFI